MKDKEIAGEASGVAIAASGNLYYLHRGSSSYGGDKRITEPTIIEIDPQTKEVKKRWGENLFVSPHGLEIDPYGQIYVTDTILNQVFKFSPEGALLQTFGEEYPFYLEWTLRIRNLIPHFPTGINADTFARPTDLTVGKDESIIVSDGYRNHRIVKFDASGKRVWEVNQFGANAGQFHLPHSITQDKDGNLYVADRNNARIQVFTPDGSFRESWNQSELGRPFAVDVGLDEHIYVADGGDALYSEGNQEQSQIVILDRNGKFLSRFGAWGTQVGQMKIPHDIEVDHRGTIYIADLQNKRLQAFYKTEQK
nr:peptidyl-alpha-hydroxyglycine alpha-amidating lyase family protein [Polycladospora coralii]